MSNEPKQLHYTILANRWFTSVAGQIGVVAIETDPYEEDATKRTWKALIGLCRGYSEAGDEQYIAAWGAPLSEQEARGFFPGITRKYKGSQS